MTTVRCKTRINLYKSISATPVSRYLGFWVQYHNESLEHHKHWFCRDDFDRCVHGTTQKYVITRPIVPTIWPIQEGINLI